MDTDLELKKALKKNDSLSKVRVEYVNGPGAKKIEMSSGFKVVAARANISDQRELSVVFYVVQKRYLKSTSMVVGLENVYVTENGFTLPLVETIDDEKFLYSLFDDDKKERNKIVELMSAKFNISYDNYVSTQIDRESLTVAGNPGPDEIIIFQFDGEPAYCSDQGIDGPICSGDAAAFIGRGTHIDFMDEGSDLCVAGQQDCIVPQYFDENARG